MKTWFCKDTQKWVSEIPRAFWIGAYDYKTGEKLYSDDIIYSADPFLRLLYKKPYIRVGNRIGDCSKLKFGVYGIPYTNRLHSKLTKVT